MTKLLSDKEYAILNKNLVSRALYDILDNLGILDCIKHNIREASVHVDRPTGPTFDVVLQVLSVHEDRATILVKQVYEYGYNPDFLVVIHFGEKYADALKPDLCFTSVFFSTWVLDGVRFEIPKGGK